METIKEFFSLNFVQLVISLLVAMSGVTGIVVIIAKFFDKVLKKPIKFFSNINDDHELLMETRKDIKQFYVNRENDRAQSRQIQKELIDAQKAISDSVNEIVEKLNEMKRETDQRFLDNEEKQNKKEQAKIKSEISKYYSLYKEKGTITNMEFEALEGLIDQYESFGGNNSFVHSIVQKEMYAWKRIDN